MVVLQQVNCRGVTTIGSGIEVVRNGGLCVSVRGLIVVKEVVKCVIVVSVGVVFVVVVVGFVVAVVDVFLGAAASGL